MHDEPYFAPLGLVVHTKGDGTERVLSAFADRLTRQGITVGGLVQHTTPQPGGKSIMELEDIRTRDRYRISLDLGPGSASCSLDPRGLTEASTVIRREIAARPDLLVINKFAVAEADGGGLLQELFTAIEGGLTILTSVASIYLDDWERLTGGVGTHLPPTPEALDRWWADLNRP